jgi:regulator of sigma E protease
MVGFQNLFYFVLFIGPLIAVHEAGHYFAAKWANVKVLKFSIGFGPKLFGFRRGETDYQVAVFPLGGFVQMAGMNPDDSVDFESTESERTFLGAPWWKRIIISFAGPAANLLFPLAAFFIIMLPESTDLAPRIGSVEPESPAATAGLRPGDLIVAIDDVAITTFTELSTIASTSADKRLAVTVEREGQRQTFQVTPASVEIAGLIESQRRGRMGISAGAQLPVLGVPEGSTAFQAGLRTFDRVIQIDGAPIRTLMDLDRALKTDAPSRHVVVVRSRQLMPGVVDPELVELDVPTTAAARPSPSRTRGRPSRRSRPVTSCTSPRVSTSAS